MERASQHWYRITQADSNPDAWCSLDGTFDYVSEEGAESYSGACHKYVLATDDDITVAKLEGRFHTLDRYGESIDKR